MIQLGKAATPEVSLNTITQPRAQPGAQSEENAGYMNNYQRVAITAFALTLAVFMPLSAYAGAMQDAICFVGSCIWGTMGTGMAILGICAVSAAAALGKASWSMALTVCAGIAIMFGAGDIANTLGIGNGCDSSVMGDFTPC